MHPPTRPLAALLSVASTVAMAAPAPAPTPSRPAPADAQHAPTTTPATTPAVDEGPAAHAPERKLFTKVFGSIPALALQITGPARGGGAAVNARVEPNPVAALGLAVDYDGLGAAASMRIGEPTADPERFGRTDYSDFQFHYHRDHLAVDLYYQRYAGLHRADDPPCAPACERLPDLTLRHIGASAFYVFDADWSLKAAFEQAHLQRRSAGSWLLGGALSDVRARNPDPIVPELARAIERADFLVATVTGGYGHTFASDGHWFFSPVLLIGFGVARGGTHTAGRVDRTYAPGSRATLRVAGGYNGPSWTTGLTVFADGPIVALGETELAWLATNIELYWGLRF
jgi:hypothetical protein